VYRVPWLKVPRRSVRTINRAMISACSRVVPAFSNTAETKVRSASAGTRMPLSGGAFI
jgi:hypothetical protein